ncbi:Hypothetical protein CINCED_3A021401 [Cinara cedri]|uniref:Uncharacterized protein n=1 Tax=Cinara cedri TaxID=506608 RepID=A0A5E4MG05_9HEMI|nr:Hypothetical protein CINCED_3A021401 [Cinara cedri]
MSRARTPKTTQVRGYSAQPRRNTLGQSRQTGPARERTGGRRDGSYRWTRTHRECVWPDWTASADPDATCAVLSPGTTGSVLVRPRPFRRGVARKFAAARESRVRFAVVNIVRPNPFYAPSDRNASQRVQADPFKNGDGRRTPSRQRPRHR